MANRYQSDDFNRRYGRGYGRQEEQFESSYGPQDERPYGQLGERGGSDHYREDETAWSTSDRFAPGRDRSNRSDDSYGYSRFPGEPRRNYDRYTGSEFQSRDRSRPSHAAETARDAFATGAGSRLAAAHGEWHDPNDYGTSSYGRDRGHGSGHEGRGFFEEAGDKIASWFEGDNRSGEHGRGFRGHGPSNYTRSDERIRDDVNDRLTDDYRVDARNITATVDNGEVTLNGTVTSRDQKRRAEDCVEDVSGVKHVQNNLRVQERTGAGGTYDPATGSGGDTTL